MAELNQISQNGVIFKKTKAARMHYLAAFVYYLYTSKLQLSLGIVFVTLKAGCPQAFGNLHNLAQRGNILCLKKKLTLYIFRQSIKVILQSGDRFKKAFIHNNTPSAALYRQQNNN